MMIADSYLSPYYLNKARIFRKPGSLEQQRSPPAINPRLKSISDSYRFVSLPGQERHNTETYTKNADNTGKCKVQALQTLKLREVLETR